MGMGAVMGGIGAIGSIGGALISSSSAQSSANQVSKADQQAEANVQKNLGTVQGVIQPYQDLGTQGASALSAALPGLTAPFQMTEAQLQATPGYQFTLGQGLESTQNAAAARGLGLSGAALKGAQNYATGLADNTFQNQFQDYQQQQTNQFNKLYNTTGVGQAAANTYANATTGATNQQNSLLLNSAQTQASATVAQGNALSNGLSGLGGSLSNGLMYNQLFGAGGSPSAIPSVTVPQNYLPTMSG